MRSSGYFLLRAGAQDRSKTPCSLSAAPWKYSFVGSSLYLLSFETFGSFTAAKRKDTKCSRILRRQGPKKGNKKWKHKCCRSGTSQEDKEDLITLMPLHAFCSSSWPGSLVKDVLGPYFHLACFINPKATKDFSYCTDTPISGQHQMQHCPMGYNHTSQ